MPLTWADSGQGPEACPITLQDAQQLCVEAGFTFRGAEDEGLPLARRADLQGASAAASGGGGQLRVRLLPASAQGLMISCSALPPAAMFEHFGVNSLSAFRGKFWALQLRPGGPGSGAAAEPPPPGPPAARSRWAMQQAGAETYVGETLNGLRHGGGILLTRVRRPGVVWCQDGTALASAARACLTARPSLRFCRCDPPHCCRCCLAIPSLASHNGRARGPGCCTWGASTLGSPADQGRWPPPGARPLRAIGWKA